MSEEELPELLASSRRGSVVAAAGCGKTELIVKATARATGRRLILTHTHAGADALRSRMRKHNVPASKFSIDTIAGWSLHYTASFPLRSGLANPNPTEEEDWSAVYVSAKNLIESGAVSNVLRASYCGVFVDEYQDCTVLQHEVIVALAEHLPTFVVGDPLQAIFDFKKQQCVNWDEDVFPHFVPQGELRTAYRWINAGSADLATWLECVRGKLKNGSTIDLASAPTNVAWHQLPTSVQERTKKSFAICSGLVSNSNVNTVVLMADAAQPQARLKLASTLSKLGFSNVEPVGSPALIKGCRAIDGSTGDARLSAVMDFIAQCMTGAERTPFLSAIESRQSGRRMGAKKFGATIDIGLSVMNKDGYGAVIELMEAFRSKSNTRLCGRELYSAMQAALNLAASREGLSLVDAAVEVQNCARHAGRRLPTRAVGSTLLVKGLEFDHAVIFDPTSMNRKHLYVALTRATKGITILSPSRSLTLKD